MKKIRNKFEGKIEKQLKKANATFSYETEKIPYFFSGHYIPDFIITTPNGKVYIETKGHFRPEAKRKMVSVKKLNPQLDIRIIFYSKKLKDIRWAEKNGFKWAISDIPQEWFEGF